MEGKEYRDVALCNQRHRPNKHKGLSVNLSTQAARLLLLAAQGLHQPPAQPATRADLLSVIRQLGVLQLDTINVVARSHYLVLWSRLGSYDPRWLDDLLSERALFEYWSHEACLLPIEDYPLYRRAMLDGNGRVNGAHAWLAAHPDVVERVLTHIQTHGATRSAAFKRTDGQKSGWWNWKDEKRALEYLHTTGVLMIAARQSFQRLYDLRERILPTWDDDQTPDAASVRRALALKAVRALGIATARQVPDYFRMQRTGIAALLEELADAGDLTRVAVGGWTEPAYLHPANQALAEAAADATLTATHTTLLSPFDPLVWDRERAREVFGFDYRIECYTPAPKRRYGYFSLPILHRGALVGRLDPKAHRKTGVFEVKALHLEPAVPLTDQLISELAAALRACASWHGTPDVVVNRSDPPQLGEQLTAVL
jgi:hypothetical protein